MDPEGIFVGPVKFPYKPFPLTEPDPVTKLDFAWRAAIKVLLWYNHKRSAPLEAILDTGSDHCIFNAEIGDALGVPVTRGAPIQLTGFMRDAKATGFLHRINMTVAAQSFEAPIVFVYGLTAVGILGQAGFFDHFVATFDWTPAPPCFDIQRIHGN